ncbi:vWA domain-containing protein [Actinomyces israelii]
MSFEPMFNSGGWLLVAVVAVLLAAALAWSARWLLRPDADPGSKWTWGRRVALAVVTVLIMAGPSVPVTQTRSTSNIEVYLVVDRTGSMAAEDWAGGPDNGGGTRLDGVRQDLMAIRDAFASARFSIIALDTAAARELPLTSDIDAVTSWINSLQQEQTARSSGSSLERALPQLSQDLRASSENSPEAARLVYVLSDGEPTDDGAAASDAGAAGLSWSQVGSMVDGGAVLGYGTPDGGQMREFEVGQTPDPSAEPTYITDPDTGQPAVSKPDTSELQNVASGLGVPYFQRTGGSDDVPTRDFTSVNVTEVFSDGRERSHRHTYFIWPLGIVAAMLLILEMVELGRADQAAAHLTRSVEGDDAAPGDAGPGGPAPGGPPAGRAGGRAVAVPAGPGAMVRAVPVTGVVPVAAAPGGPVPGAPVPGAVAPPGYPGGRAAGPGAPMGGPR